MHRRAAWFPAVLLLALGASAGCYSERSFPMHAADYRPAPDLPPARSVNGDLGDWLEQMHGRFADLLPRRDGRRALLPRDLKGRARTMDVYRHFGLVRSHLASIWYNNSGLAHSAQVTGRRRMIDRTPPAWPGFEDVWIPVNDHLRLAGRFGRATQGGKPRRADCIILLPGLLGDNSSRRTRDIAIALREHGLHVLALELRGYGQTEARYPDVPYTYGVFETGDILAVAEWLQDLPYVRDTGLIGFCWGANQALLAAWEDGRSDDDANVSPRLRPLLRPRNGRRHFRAGVLAFSPALEFERILDQLERPWPLLVDPVLNRIQAGVDSRARRKGFPPLHGSLRRLIEYEARRTPVYYPQIVRDGLDYLRLVPYAGREAPNKLEAVRVPVLIVHGANDPLGSTQTVADLIARTRNPLVAGLILPGGGHNGFPAYARSYFYNLLLHFFDARPGPLPAGNAPGVMTRAPRRP